MEHDPLCPLNNPCPFDHVTCIDYPQCEACVAVCRCLLIRRIEARTRADEREKAAQRVADPELHEAWCDLSRPHGPAVCDCYHAACIAAARGEE